MIELRRVERLRGLGASRFNRFYLETKRDKSGHLLGGAEAGD